MADRIFNFDAIIIKQTHNALLEHKKQIGMGFAQQFD